MTCCEGWTSCNGFSLLILILLGVVINCIPLGISLVEADSTSQNPISCYEWWFPGIIGAGLMVSNTYMNRLGEGCLMPLTMTFSLAQLGM